MKIVACYNIKGGVGKTATAVNLGYQCAQGGVRTLLWDLDPQAACSYYLRIKPKVKGGADKLIRGKVGLDERVKATDHPNLDLLPADSSYRNLDLMLNEVKKPVHRLAKLLAELEPDYDVIFLDCPPALSLMTEAIFAAADAMLIPLVPTTLSLRALAQILRFRKEHGFTDVQLIPFFSMVDRRKKLHREIIDTLPQRQPAIPTVEIPYSADVERMGVERAPVGVYARHTRAGQAYSMLWETVVARLGGV